VPSSLPMAGTRDLASRPVRANCTTRYRAKSLSLTLLVIRILTDDAYNAFALNNLALWAATLH
jgi:hypothetical protein